RGPGAPMTCRLCSVDCDLPRDDVDTLSLHDALPIWGSMQRLDTESDELCLLETMGLPLALTTSFVRVPLDAATSCAEAVRTSARDRKSTRLNSSHVKISYAVFCLKKQHRQVRRGAG